MFDSIEDLKDTFKERLEQRIQEEASDKIEEEEQ